MTQLTQSVINKNNNSDDIITQIIGNFGRWQLRTVLLIFLCKIPTVWFMACIIFTAPTPKISDYLCIPLENITENQIRMSNRVSSHPSIVERNTDREFNTDFCSIYEESLERNSSKFNNFSSDDVTIKKLMPCHHFEYNAEFTSLIIDFNLICSRQLLLSVTQCFHGLGTLLGGLLSVVLLNYVSPRTLMFYGMIFQILYGNLTGFIKQFEFHLIFRCVTSLCCAVMFNAGQAIFSDITGGKAKTVATTLSELFWSIGLIMLPGISIFIDNWSYLYVAISSPTILLVFLHRWIAESPRWLIKKGRIDEALQVLLESAAFNGKEIPLDIEERLKAYAEQQQHSSPSKYCSIWDGKTKNRYILAVHWAWVWSVMLYNAMILNIRSFGVDHVHVNTVILGFSEMLGVFVGLFFVLYTRRRWLWSGYFITIAGLLTFFIWLVPKTIKESRRVGLEMIFCVGLKMANAAALAILVTCTGEILATHKRQMLMISVNTWSRIWLLIAPFIIATAMFHPLIPITVFAVLAVINGIFMCFLSKHFLNSNQPRIERVPTLETFRRNSALLLLKRNSTCSELTANSDLPPRVSISDIWTIAGKNESLPENDENVNSLE